MRARHATPADVPVVVEMAHVMKRQLAAWSPQYFRPRAGAEQMHALDLEYLVGSPDHETLVLEDAGAVAGFFAVVPQTRHRWVDDVYLGDPAGWGDAVTAIRAVVEEPWVTCVSRLDDARAEALRAAGLRVASTFWSRSLADVAPKEPEPVTGAVETVGDVPRHTFGPSAFDPATPGALVVSGGEGGVVVGSPGANPPLYDPGGPACVVDRVEGPDRHTLVGAAMATAAARGDAAMVVVCGSDDSELRSVLESHGFRAEVDLFAT